MKNIFKTLIPCLALSVALTGCYDEMDDKAVIDAQHALANTPTVSMASATALDYASASVAGSLSSVEGVVEAGFMVATAADFSDAKIYTVDNIASTFEMTLSGLAEQTTYSVKAYAFLGDDRIVYSEASSITTPQAPPLSAELLTGKTYTASVTSYFGSNYTFAVTLVADAADPTKIYVQNLDPYFAENGFVAEVGCNIFEGVLDVENETITVAQGQLIGYNNVALTVFNDADPDVATGYSDLTIKVISKGAALRIENAFGMNEGGFYELYYGGITLNVK